MKEILPTPTPSKGTPVKSMGLILPYSKWYLPLIILLLLTTIASWIDWSVFI